MEPASLDHSIVQPMPCCYLLGVSLAVLQPTSGHLQLGSKDDLVGMGFLSPLYSVSAIKNLNLDQNTVLVSSLSSPSFPLFQRLPVIQVYLSL